MSHLPLDARAILDYLNELGYRNISAEQLKEFMKDLRKLIKYEETLGINAHQEDYFERLFKRTTASFRAKVGKENGRGERAVDVKSTRTDERHVLRPFNQIAHDRQADSRTVMGMKGNEGQTARTFDVGGTPKHMHQKQNRKQQQKHGENLSREKAWQNSGRIPFAECKGIRGPEPQSSQRSSSRPATTGEVSQQKHVQTATSGAKEGKSKISEEMKQGGIPQRDARVETKITTSRGRTRSESQERGTRRRSPSGGSYTTARSMGVMIPRQCTATRRRRPLSKDPVALYHYYQSEWNHFREQIPGESSHAELRWMIRERLLDPN